MAKDNEADILTGDWNPIVGCSRYSPGCKSCWWLDGIMPWQKRLGNLPKDLVEGTPHLLEQRLHINKLKSKRGIIGVVQHGDLFWNRVSDETITRVLDVVDEVGELNLNSHGDLLADTQRQKTKFVIWTKRAKRASQFLTKRYPKGLPPYLGVGVSVENQKLTDDRLPWLLQLVWQKRKGAPVRHQRFVMAEPLLGPIDLSRHPGNNWIVVGSETGHHARPLDLDWVRDLRDYAVPNDIPFFVKQLGSSHKVLDRVLDGEKWDQFPYGYWK